MKLGEAGQAKVATFPSGAMTLDLALGGGLPRGPPAAAARGGGTLRPHAVKLRNDRVRSHPAAAR